MDKSYNDLLRENECLKARLRHLLESETIRAYDAVKPRTKQYMLDIRKLDELVRGEVQREELKECPVTEREAEYCQYRKGRLYTCKSPYITAIKINGKLAKVVCDNVD